VSLYATFPERVIVGNDDYLVRRVAKAQFAEFLSGNILCKYGLEKATRKCGRQPKETRSHCGAHLVTPLKDQALPKMCHLPPEPISVLLMESPHTQQGREDALAQLVSRPAVSSRAMLWRWSAMWRRPV
jgi:hypothetical protein